MIDWIPVVLVTFKIFVLGIGMFFAVKWHYDRGNTAKEKGAVLRTSSLVAAVFALSVVVLLLLTFDLARNLGLDLTFP